MSWNMETAPLSFRSRMTTVLDQPVFHKQGTISGDFLEDWLYYLNEKNMTELKRPQDFRDYLTPERVVEVIFWICNSLKQAPEVRYVTVELFDRFMVNHLRDLNAELKRRNAEGRNKISWQEIEGRIQKQIFLRIMSCVQIASKLSSHSRCLNIAEVSSILNHLRCGFSTDNILKSEIRVLRTLNYEIDVLTPLAYAEPLLEILKYNNPQFEPDAIYATVLDVLDLYYMSRSRFYDLVYKINLGDESLMLSPVNAQQMRSVKSDYMLLSSSFLVAAGALHGDELKTFLLNSLTKICSNAKSDMQTMTSAFVTMIANG